MNLICNIFQGIYKGNLKLRRIIPLNKGQVQKLADRLNITVESWPVTGGPRRVYYISGSRPGSRVPGAQFYAYSLSQVECFLLGIAYSYGINPYQGE